MPPFDGLLLDSKTLMSLHLGRMNQQQFNSKCAYDPFSKNLFA